MGNNNGDYLREAARVLAYDGTLHIVETASRIDKVEDIGDRLYQLGFTLADQHRLGQPEFVHITARRSDREPDQTVDLI